MKNLALILVFVLTGCGGSSFTVGAVDEADGGPTTDALTAATGGAPAVGTGGQATGIAGEADGGGAPSSGGSGGSSGAGDGEADGGHDSGCTLVTHDNGAGQTWQDCMPFGTYNEAQAMKACKASGAAMCIVNKRCGVGAVQGWNADVSHLIGEWGYEDFAMGYVSLDYNLCNPGDPNRRQWR